MRAVANCFIVAAAAMLVACATQAPAPGPTWDEVTIPNGYEKIMVNGEARYCRDDRDAGSRVAHSRVCLTAVQLKLMQENAQNFMNDVQGRYGLIPSATGAPAGMGSSGGMGH